MSVSGVAGPDGGTPDKPVGTVWLAWAERGDSGIEMRAGGPQRLLLARPFRPARLRALLTRLLEPQSEDALGEEVA